MFVNFYIVCEEFYIGENVIATKDIHYLILFFKKNFYQDHTFDLQEVRQWRSLHVYLDA